MKTLTRYIGREVLTAILLIFTALVMLFAFFDLVRELDDVGKAGYKIQHAIAYVALGLPSHVYELMPVAALIGCIYALAQFASSSEFTAMRAAGMSRAMALRSVIGVGIVLAALTAMAGDARGRGQGLALAYLDIDGFKTVNETRGHLVGDRVLEVVAGCLEDVIGDAGTAARIGGDEFDPDAVAALEIVSAQIKLNNKTVRRVSGRALTRPVELRGLPKGRFKLTVSVTDEAGAKRLGTRTYRTCAAKRAR